MKTFAFLFLLGIPFILTVSAFAIEEDDATLTKRELAFLEKLKYFPPDKENALKDQIKTRITKDKAERLKERREYLLSLFQKHTTEIRDAANPASRLKSGEDSERVTSLANSPEFSDDVVAKASSEAETQIESEDKELEEVLSHCDDDKEMDKLLPHLLDRSGALKKNSLHLIERSRSTLANEKRNHPQQEIDDDNRMIELLLEFALPEHPVRDAMADARKIVNLSNAVRHQKNLALANLLVEDAKLEKHIRRQIIRVAVNHGNSDALQMLIEPSESVRDKIFALEIAWRRRRLYRRFPSMKDDNKSLAENIYAIVVSLLEDIPPRKAKKLADEYDDKDLLKEVKSRASLSCKDKVVNTAATIHLMCHLFKHIS